MSLRRRDNKKYNRAINQDIMEAAIEAYYDVVDDNDWHYFDYEGVWEYDYFYPGYGGVNSMSEYHQMHILTLLRSLNLKEAKLYTDSMGW